MPTAGGLLGKSEHIPKHGKKHSSYTDAGEGQWIIMPNGMKMAKEWKKGDLMSGMSSRSNRRFNFVVKKWAKTGSEMGISMEDLEDAKERHEVIDLDQD